MLKSVKAYFIWAFVDFSIADFSLHIVGVDTTWKNSTVYYKYIYTLVFPLDTSGAFLINEMFTNGTYYTEHVIGFPY